MKQSSYQVKNVFLNNNTRNVKSRVKLIKWVNSTLKSEFKNIVELSTGAAYCQLLEMLFPGTIALNTVYFYTNLEVESFENFKALQRAFRKLDIKHEMPVDRLAKRQIADNLEFLQWFERFFTANYNGRHYDPIAGRSGRAIGYGPTKFRYSNCYNPNPFIKAARCVHAVKRQKSLPCLALKGSKQNYQQMCTYRLTAGRNSEPNLTGKSSISMCLPCAENRNNTKCSYIPVPVDPCIPQFDVAFLDTLDIPFTSDMTKEELDGALDAHLGKMKSRRNKHYAKLLTYEQLTDAYRNGPGADFAKGVINILSETADGFACPTDD